MTAKINNITQLAYFMSTRNINMNKIDIFHVDKNYSVQYIFIYMYN